MSRMELILDDEDYSAIQQEIAERQRRGQRFGGTANMLPDGDSNLAGAILAECCRDLFDAKRKE